ncbi:MAG: hypothetical protein JNN26_18585 [Candidatus Obscuribacter sp.]|nr:hypothetical protein [Candidatus Obscuribacter sp.]
MVELNGTRLAMQAFSKVLSAFVKTMAKELKSSKLKPMKISGSRRRSMSLLESGAGGLLSFRLCFGSTLL